MSSGDDAALLLCEVKGPHTLSQRTLGRPPLPVYRLASVLDQLLGVFEVCILYHFISFMKMLGQVNLDFKEVSLRLLP